MNSLKWKCFWQLNCVLMLNWIIFNKTDYLHKNGFGVNNLQRLIYHKTKQTKPTYVFLHIDTLVLVNQQKLAFIISVQTLGAVETTCLEKFLIGMDDERERERVIEIHTVSIPWWWCFGLCMISIIKIIHEKMIFSYLCFFFNKWLLNLIIINSWLQLST